MKHRIPKQIRNLFLCILLVIVSGCTQQQEKELPALVYETELEYALAFFHAMNTKDAQTIDALLDKEAIVVYQDNPEQIRLGYTTDPNSHISYLFNLNSRYEDIQEEKNNLVSIMTNFIYSNKFTEDIWNTTLDERMRYEFVIENQRITLIYIYTNTQEKDVNEQYTRAGTGLEVSIAEDNSHLLITNVYAGTPAKVLNLQEGDKILAIDGIAIQDMNTIIDEYYYRLLGKENTQVTIDVQRQTNNQVQTLTMTRMLLEDYIPKTDEEILNELEETNEPN